ncbi:MAG: YicC/YloC family endoribonuclease [Polyangiaceae bacterium]
MTGYGIGDVALPRGRVVAEVRSVNGRTLDVRIRLPEALGDLTIWAEQLVRKRLRRGRVEASIRAEGCVSTPVEIDLVRAESALEAVRGLAGRLAANGEPSDGALSLSLLSVVPGLFVSRAKEVDELRRACQEALDLALTDLQESRLREGQATRKDLTLHLDTLRSAHARLRERAADLPQSTRDRLLERLARLDVAPRLGVDVLDPRRIEAEVALLAQRCDVSEELARLEAHFVHFTSVVEGAEQCDEATLTGKHLDFLLQEMSREVATLGAKAQDTAISRDVVIIRVELERMREQVQNVE